MIPITLADVCIQERLEAQSRVNDEFDERIDKLGQDLSQRDRVQQSLHADRERMEQEAAMLKHALTECNVFLGHIPVRK